MTRDYKAEFEAAGRTVKKVPEGQSAHVPVRDFTPRLKSVDHCGRELWVNDEGEPIFFG